MFHQITVNNVTDRELSAFTLWFQANHASTHKADNVKECFQRWRSMPLDSKQYWFVKAANMLIELRESVT